MEEDEGRAPDRRHTGRRGRRKEEAVRIRRGGKTALEAALVSKRSSSHVSEREKAGKKESEGRERGKLGEARRMEVVGPTPRWMGETKGETGGGRGGSR